MESSSQRCTWQSRDGIELAGEHHFPQGSKDLPSVVFAHGFAQTRKSWRSSLKILASQGYSATAFDARGHGASDYAEPNAYRPDDFLSDLRLVCHQTRAQAVVGASLGGLIALLAAGEPPQLPLQALVLVDVAPRWRADGQARIQRFLQARPEGFASLEEAREAVASYLPHRSPASSDGILSNLRQGSNGRYFWHWDPAMLSMFRNVDIYQQRVLRAARQIRIPTLLISGGQSELLGEEHIQECLELMPHAEHRQVPAAHHMVAGDDNRAFTRQVLDWLESTLGSDQASRPKPDQMKEDTSVNKRHRSARQIGETA